MNLYKKSRNIFCRQRRWIVDQTNDCSQMGARKVVPTVRPRSFKQRTNCERERSPAYEP